MKNFDEEYRNEKWLLKIETNMQVIFKIEMMAAAFDVKLIREVFN